jgi:hypothetical protein
MVRLRWLSGTLSCFTTSAAVGPMSRRRLRRLLATKLTLLPSRCQLPIPLAVNLLLAPYRCLLGRRPSSSQSSETGTLSTRCRLRMATFSSGLKCFRSFLIRSLRSLNGRTLSPFPTGAGQQHVSAPMRLFKQATVFERWVSRIRVAKGYRRSSMRRASSVVLPTISRLFALSLSIVSWGE